MIDYIVARDKLAQFETADEIADFFRREGVQGEKGMSDRCPIAQWMTEQTGGPIVVSTLEMWNAGAEDFLDNDTIHRINHTEAMTDFVDRFDSGFYSDLQARPEYYRWDDEFIV